MVLLHLTPSLDSRLSSLQAQLPTELAALVAAALTPPATAEGEKEAAKEETEQLRERTVSHELLVKVSTWARKEKEGEQRCERREREAELITHFEYSELYASLVTTLNLHPCTSSAASRACTSAPSPDSSRSR